MTGAVTFNWEQYMGKDDKLVQGMRNVLDSMHAEGKPPMPHDADTAYVATSIVILNVEKLILDADAARALLGLVRGE